MKASRNVLRLAAVAMMMFAAPLNVYGYQFWSDATNSTGQCAGCHSGFRENNNYFSLEEGASWGTSLHNAHLNNTDITGGTNGSCSNCHDGTGATGNRVRINSSGNAKDGVNAIACMGCHGRLEDANDLTVFGEGWGAGLRQHHENSVAAAGACVGCHADASSASFTTAPENVMPPYYATTNNTALDPDAPMDACSPNGEEDFSGDGGGTDNDGDDVYDLLDSDCVPATPTPGDFDYDGMADVLWRRPDTRQVYFWQMSGSEILSSAPVARPAQNWEIVGTGDYNGDNRADVLWRNSVTRQIYYWQMNGAEITAAAGVATPSDDNWRVIGNGDYDGDGNADILWRHLLTGQVYYWRMDGATILSSAPVAMLADLDWQAVGSGDYDGDGPSDIMWRHDLTGQVYYWRMNGATILSSAKVAQPSDLKWHVVGNGDYNGDGMDDLMWRNIGVGGTGKVYYWQMNGATIQGSSRVSIVSDLSWQVVGDGDYDGDGKSDVLWLHGGNGQIYFWQQDGSTTLNASPVATLSELAWAVVYEE